MEFIFADRSVSITEFKKNPARVVSDACGKPVAVLKNNRPDFYAVPPEVFERISEILDDLMISDEVREREASGDFVDVNLEDL